MANMLLDVPENHYPNGVPTLWLKGAILLTICYIVFGLILIGIPAVSRGAVIFALIGLLWVLFGMATQGISFPRILFLPLVFYVYVLFSGVYMDSYPVDYMGQMTTIWVGAIVLAVFVANGVSLNLIISGFVVMFVVNMAAIAVGYDGYLINQGDEDLASLETTEVQRYSGLAGQSNLLISLVFTLPFLLFLTKKKVGFIAYILVIAGAVTTTILTGSRSPIILTLLFTLTGAIWLIGSSILRTLAIAASLVLGLALIVFFNSDSALTRIEQSRFGEVVVVQRTVAALDKTTGESTDVRKEFITESWDYFFQKPIVGYGPNAFGTVTGADTYAHNNFVEIAVNWGVIGLVLYYLMYLASLVGIALNLQYKLPMIATLLYLMLADWAFVTFIDRAMILCLCLLLVKIYATKRSSRGNHAHNRSSRKRRRRRRKPA